MDQILQVRIGGQVISRMTLAELRAELQSGSIGQFHEVSLDGKSWFDARQFAFETTNPPAAPGATMVENSGAGISPSATNSPAEHAPIDHSPVDHAPVDHAPVDHASVGHASGSPHLRQPPTSASQPMAPNAQPMAPNTMSPAASSSVANSHRLPTSVDLAVPNIGHSAHDAQPAHEQRPAKSYSPATNHPEPSSPSPAHRPTYPKEITWMAIIRSQECGPFGSDQLRQMASFGKIGLGDLVWCEGYPDWVPVEQQFPDFFPHAPTRRVRRVPRDQQSYSLLAVASLVAALIWGGGFFSAVSVILGILGLIDVLGGAGYRKGALFAVLGLILGVGGIVGSLFFWTALIG